MKSIKTKGIIFSFILIFISVATMGICGYTRIKQILVGEVNNAVERVATESAAHLSNYLNQFIAPLNSLSDNEQIESMDWTKQRVILETQINEYYLNVAVVDINGVAHFIDETKVDLSDRHYIQKALSGEVVFSEVITSRKISEPVIMVAKPIYRENEIVGALIARLDVDFLSDYALTRSYGDNGKAYIISEEGSFISRPEYEKAEKGYNLFEIAKKNNNYSSLSEFVRDSKENETGYGKFYFNKESVLMGYATVVNTNWKIYIGTNEEDALENLHGLKNMILVLMAVTLMISTSLAYFFVSRFTKPIEEMDQLFSVGARGDLTIRCMPKTKDEIGRMGLSFNRMMDKIKTLTQYDPLTALLNQYVLEKDVITLILNEEKKDFSLIMVAIDKFSFINETYGYITGDLILCEVAKRLLFCINENYQVYRYKGDEFVVLGNSKLTENEIEAKAQNILDKINEIYHIEGKSIDIRFSIGIFVWKDNTRAEEPLKAVTHAKNYARYIGSNQIQMFDLEIHNKLTVALELQADIVNGLKEDQFFLVYQPLFYLNSEKIAEIEALIRWKHPEKGMLYPDQFIDLAEQSGSIIDIDYWVIETTCKQLKQWKEKKVAPVLLSINISAKTFETKKFIPDLIETVNRYGIEPSLLQLEITERILIKSIEESILKLQELRTMGFRIAIDDFGIGYSSLNYIVRLPIDCIKIDKSFVQKITSSKEAKTIVSTITNLCKELNMNVIAEGIESYLELEYLKIIECDIGQGYYFSKPVDMEDLEMKHLK